MLIAEGDEIVEIERADQLDPVPGEPHYFIIPVAQGSSYNTRLLN
jgi:hypothetical protein